MKISLPSCFALVFALFLTSQPALAEDDAATQIKKFTDAHQEEMEAFGKKMQGLPRGEQRKLYQTDYPDASEAVKAITTIVKANPKDDAALEGITWIMRNSRGASMDAEIFGLLEKHHLNNEEIIDVVASAVRYSSPEATAFLKNASEKSDNKNVRGMAVYSRAMSIERDTTKQEEYIALIEKLVADHSDLEIRGRNIAERAKGKLFAAKNLGIGKEAPEIIGKDVDGKEMKLSDYRGKVVVIDFWGDW